MKKAIHQTLAIALLSTSLSPFTTAFAHDNNVSIVKESRQSEIRNIIAELSMKMEQGEGQRKSLAEAVKLIQEKNISTHELVNFAAAGMEVKEAIAFKARFQSKMDQAAAGLLSDEDLANVLVEVMGGTRGLNFRPSCDATFATAWIAGIIAIAAGISAIDASGQKSGGEDSIKQLKLDRVALEGEMNILLSEGLPASSYYIASMKADIAYIDEQIAQTEKDVAKNKKDLMTYAIVAAVSTPLAIWAANADCGY